MFQFHLYFSFSPWGGFALQPEVSGKFVEMYFFVLLGSLSNDDGDGHENVT